MRALAPRFCLNFVVLGLSKPAFCGCAQNYKNLVFESGILNRNLTRFFQFSTLSRGPKMAKTLAVSDYFRQMFNNNSTKFRQKFNNKSTKPRTTLIQILVQNARVSTQQNLTWTGASPQNNVRFAHIFFNRHLPNGCWTSHERVLG